MYIGNYSDLTASTVLICAARILGGDGTRLRVCELWQEYGHHDAHGNGTSAIHLVISGSDLLRSASMACISEAVSQQSHRLE
jgi:hypothetical protein